jgi:predicted Zn finger-like uncharacterized protein
MILTCPACATRYQTDEAKFPPAGRQVRCAKCGHVWHQAGSAAARETIIVQPPAPEPPVPGSSAPGTPVSKPSDPEVSAPWGEGSHIRAQVHIPQSLPPPPPRALLPLVGIVLGWIGLIAVVLLIGISAVRYRQEIAVIWPQSAGVYSSLGLDVNTRGIDFIQVEYHRESEDGQVVLAVSGRIVNAGARELPVPQIVRVALSDAANHEIYHWTFTPPVQTLKPGQSAGVLTRLSSPPAAARHLEMRFAKDRS